MGRRKGDGLGRFGGRKKGTSNKVTADFKDFIKSVLNNSKQDILTDLQAVEPYQRLQILERLISYVVPKQTQSQIDASLDIENNFVQIPQGMTKEECQKILDDHKSYEGMNPEEFQKYFYNRMKQLGWTKTN